MVIRLMRAAMRRLEVAAMIDERALRLPQRRSIRLDGYDYTQAGAYFVTICVRDPFRLLGAVVDDEMTLNQYGDIVNEEWAYTALVRAEIALDAYVVMPNHIHGIVVVTDDGHKRAHAASYARPLRSPSYTVGSLVRGFKAAVTTRINTLCGTPGVPFWQRNYYEHVVRGDADLERIRAYIAHNPARWAEDTYNHDLP